MMFQKRESEGQLSTARSQTCHSRRSEWVFHVHSSFLGDCKGTNFFRTLQMFFSAIPRNVDGERKRGTKIFSCLLVHVTNVTLFLVPMEPFLD